MLQTYHKVHGLWGIFKHEWIALLLLKLSFVVFFTILVKCSMQSLHLTLHIVELENLS